MKNNITLIGLLFISTFYNLSAQQQYRVSIKEKNKLHVEAELELNSKNLYMEISTIPSLEGGTASFVKNLIVIDKKGNSIKVENTKNDEKYYTWSLKTSKKNVKVIYDIDMSHEKYNWPFGIEEVAYNTSEGSMIVGRYLFIIPNLNESETFNVSFDLPKKWKATTPWNYNKKKQQYSNIVSEDFTNNVLFIGTHKEEKIVLNSTTINLVLGNTLKDKKSEIVSFLTPNLKVISELFGETPRNSYLVVMTEGPLGGGAFNQSYSMQIQKPINKGTSALWGHGMVHETLHLWNGRTLKGKDRRYTEWFNEGATEYISTIIESKTGSLTRGVVERKIEAGIRRNFLAQMMAPPISLKESGRNKNKNRMKIYGLGTIFTFILDIEIRNANIESNGILDVIKFMYQEIAMNDQLYTFEDIIKHTNRVAGKNLTHLFDDYVIGMKELNLNYHFRKAGLQITNMFDEAYLSSSPNSSIKAKRIRENIFGWTE